MAKDIIMPKFEMTQEEATVVKWLKGEGEAVQKGEPILEVETDKVIMEVEAPATGRLGGLRCSEGDIVPVTEVIGYVLAEGEQPPNVEVTQEKPAEASVEQPPTPKTVTPPSGKVRATPVARRLARTYGIDLASIKGSGPKGRVQRADVEAAQAAKQAQKKAPESKGTAEPEIIPLEGMRRTIAQRLQASYQEAPHIMITRDVNMSGAIAYRRFANEHAPEGTHVSMTAVLIQVCAWALRQHPILNSHFQNDKIIMQSDVNIGMAVALEEGLIVPVVRRADQKGLLEIGAEVADLGARAREGRLTPSDVADGTFTLSNLGMFGVDQFTAIINPPQVAILAVGRIAKRFVPDDKGQPVTRPMMTVTLAVDHRVVDGAAAARFLATFSDALRYPTALLL